MRFFSKTNHRKRNILIAGLLSLIIVCIFIVFYVKLPFYKENSIDINSIENDKKTLEMEDNDKLLSEQKSNDIEEKEILFTRIRDMFDLSPPKFIDMSDLSHISDLLYRYEPIYKPDLLYRYEGYDKILLN